MIGPFLGSLVRRFHWSSSVIGSSLGSSVIIMSSLTSFSDIHFKPLNFLITNQITESSHYNTFSVDTRSKWNLHKMFICLLSRMSYECNLVCTFTLRHMLINLCLCFSLENWYQSLTEKIFKRDFYFFML